MREESMLTSSDGPHEDEPAFETTWPEVPLPPVPPAGPGSWLVLTDEHPAALRRAVALALALAVTGDVALSLPRDDLAELPRLLAERPVRGVVFLTGAPHAYHDPEDAQELLLAALSVIARLGAGVRFHLVTQSRGEPGLACLRGLVRVLAFERPGLRASLVDVDAWSDAAVLARELRSGAADDEVRWRHDVRYAARLARVSRVDDVVPGPGAYVITGGFGAFGSAAARRLAEGGATRIVLSGRSHQTVELSDVDVVVVAGDIAEPGVAERLVEAATADGLPLRGIVHAAGVSAGGLAEDVTAEDVAAVWRPKVLGARRLHEATADTPPQWWLMCSSAAALSGAPGRTAEATADAWLDAFAVWRRSRGLAAATVYRGGGGPVTEAPRRPFFAAVHASTHERLADIFAGVLDCPPGDVTPNVPLVELGLDSRSAIQARAAAEREFGVAPPVPLLLRGVSLDDVAEYVTAPGAPRDQVERWLRGVWREVLGDGDHDVHQRFPGTPEQAEALAARVAEVHAVDGLFTTPTIAAMADLVRAALDRPRPRPRGSLPL
jgi:acyl carrier protein